MLLVILNRTKPLMKKISLGIIEAILIKINKPMKSMIIGR